MNDLIVQAFQFPLFLVVVVVLAVILSAVFWDAPEFLEDGLERGGFPGGVLAMRVTLGLVVPGLMALIF